MSSGTGDPGFAPSRDSGVAGFEEYLEAKSIAGPA